VLNAVSINQGSESHLIQNLVVWDQNVSPRLLAIHLGVVGCMLTPAAPRVAARTVWPQRRRLRQLTCCRTILGIDDGDTSLMGVRLCTIRIMAGVSGLIDMTRGMTAGV